MYFTIYLKISLLLIISFSLDLFFKKFLGFSPFSFFCFEKQPPEVFCMKRCSQKICKIRRKILSIVSFLVRLQTQACNYIEKEILAQVFSSKVCKISKNIFFTQHLCLAASLFHKHVFQKIPLFFSSWRNNISTKLFFVCNKIPNFCVDSYFFAICLSSGQLSSLSYNHQIWVYYFSFFHWFFF